jgi:hypothetical protein
VVDRSAFLTFPFAIVMRHLRPLRYAGQSRSALCLQITTMTSGRSCHFLAQRADKWGTQIAKRVVNFACQSPQEDDPSRPLILMGVDVNLLSGCSESPALSR